MLLPMLGPPSSCRYFLVFDESAGTGRDVLSAHRPHANHNTRTCVILLLCKRDIAYTCSGPLLIPTAVGVFVSNSVINCGRLKNVDQWSAFFYHVTTSIQFLWPLDFTTVNRCLSMLKTNLVVNVWLVWRSFANGDGDSAAPMSVNGSWC